MATVEWYICTATCQHNSRIFKAHEKYPAGDVGPKPCEYLIPIVPAPPQDDKRVQRVIADMEREVAEIDEGTWMNGKKFPPHPASVRVKNKLLSAIEALKGPPAAAPKKAVKDGRE